MRRFFRAQRDEDYSQIQYLTAKCTRLAHDKAVLDREFLLSVEREKKLQNDLEVVAARLLHQEQTNTELRAKQNQLISRIHQQQDLVELLQQRLILLAEESSRDTEVLRQVGSELLCLQSSKVKLEGLIEELHAEARHRVAVAEGLHAELRTVELEELQDINKTLTDELKDLRKAHQEEVSELQQQNEGSLRKLQETAEQFEWLCQQQRYWMCCVKRFKDCLMEERKALLQQVDMLETKAEDLRMSSHDDRPAQSLLCPLQAPDRCDGLTSWDVDAVTDLESQVEKSNLLYEELFSRSGSPLSGHQKPP
ncbi:hypothetical protein Q5P01_008630 [Channa striata]|uniref:Uncharacterized protein n=1 Tax=Channa striata TaxID=64152 RepID=A0AA88MZQ1_CHASR|nr:hypothetical protein Q5P01_008630 [Channa striata]